MIQTATVEGLMQRQGVRQFVKFCVIGFTSMLIDVGIWKFLMNSFGWHWIPAQTVSFAFAVTNGFIWNSLWTFRGLGAGRRHEQYGKFVAVNIIGLLLNIVIMKAVLIAFTGRLIFHGSHDPLHLNIAKGIAIICVAFWNFLANKKWTFAGAPLEA